MQAILTFDVGTTAMKCCVFDSSFQMVASRTTEYALCTPAADRVEVDPEIYWTCLCGSARAVLESGVRPADICAVGITTQGETMIALDHEGRPLLPVIVWLDSRAQKQAAELARALDLRQFYRTTGLPETGGALPLAKLKWLMEESGAGSRVSKVLLLEDYLIYRLTGALAGESSLLCSTGYLNIHTRTYETDYLKLAGADVGLLPEILPPGSVAGSVTQEAARQTGLLPGTPVCCTAMDQTAGAVGAGNIAPGVVSETTGTCLTVAATTDRPDFDLPAPLQYYTHVDGHYLALAYNPTAAIVMKWFKDQFLTDSRAWAESGQNVYEYMSSLAAAVPPGCDGLLMLPHLSGKSMPEACGNLRGAFLGLSLQTTRGHFVRAVMEGVAFMLQECLDLFRQAGIRPAELRSLGGAARDKLWCAIKASVTGCRVRTTGTQEATSLGAAILSARAVGMDRDLNALSRRAVRMADCYEPDPALRPVYEAGYEAYLRLDRLARTFYEENVLRT